MQCCVDKSRSINFNQERKKQAQNVQRKSITFCENLLKRLTSVDTNIFFDIGNSITTLALPLPILNQENTCYWILRLFEH